jgi:hypothetical protein
MSLTDAIRHLLVTCLAVCTLVGRSLRDGQVQESEGDIEAGQLELALSLPFSANLETQRGGRFTYETAVEETLWCWLFGCAVLTCYVEVSGGDLKLGEADHVLRREHRELEVLATHTNAHGSSQISLSAQQLYVRLAHPDGGDASRRRGERAREGGGARAKVPVVMACSELGRC